MTESSDNPLRRKLRERHPWLGCAVVILLILVVGAWWAFDMWHAMYQGAQFRPCGSNLQQIARAMRLYNDEYGSLPPAHIADANGKPMHSWRVLLLPYFEQQALYDRYDFTEPWDGPNNRKLAEFMPDLYRCRLDRGGAPFMTSYLVITGKNTPFETGRALSLDQIDRSLGESHIDTIMVAECAQSGIHWMEPRDLELTQMSMKINDADDNRRGVRSRHRHVGAGAWVALCDTSTAFLSEKAQAASFPSQLTFRPKAIRDKKQVGAKP